MNDRKVILIGGPPGAGKTTLGRALAAELGIASLTADDLALAARAITTAETHPGLHLMNIPDAGHYFTFSSVDKLISDASAQHDAMWPAIERVIRVRSKSPYPVVIDGWFMRPNLIADLDLEGVSSYWLVVAPEVLEQRERELNLLLGETPDFDRMHRNFMGRSLWHNDLIEQQATQCGLPILRQDGTRTVEELVASVLN